MFIFGFAQILIFCLSIFSTKLKKFNDIISNICGLIYMTTSLWYYSILYLYYYDTDFFVSYRFYMKNSDIFDSIRLGLYYYLIGELFGFMVNFLLVPIFFVGCVCLFL